MFDVDYFLHDYLCKQEGVTCVGPDASKSPFESVLSAAAAAGMVFGGLPGEQQAAARLEPYGGPGGGHHVPAKSAFVGEPAYNPLEALAIPNDEMDRLGLSHSAITGAQMSAYRAFAATGKTLTWNDVSTIESNALIRGGMSEDMAQATVEQAITALKNAGVSGPTRIPWGG